MYRAPVNTATLGYPMTGGPHVNACSYAATGEIICTDAQLQRGTTLRTQQTGTRGFGVGPSKEAFDVPPSSDVVGTPSPNDIAMHTAVSQSAASLLQGLAVHRAATASAQVTASVVRSKAMQAFSDATTPSMTAGVYGTPPDTVLPGLIWYRYDQGYFADNPAWFKSLTYSAADRTFGWADMNHVGPGDNTPNYLPIGQTSAFSLLVRGYFIPKTTGVHIFKLGSDDASYLWWGSEAAVPTPSKTVMTASIALPGEHPLIFGSVSLNMAAGTAYPLSIMYGQNRGGYGFKFSFVSPGSPETTDGTGYYFSDLPSNTIVASAVKGL